MKKKYLIILLYIICFISLIGCNNISLLKQKNKMENGTFIVKPSSLFNTEELKKLQPHLDMTSGCVEIKYKGNKRFIGLKYEIWEKGKLERICKIFSVRIPNEYERAGEEEYRDIISISLKDILLDDMSLSKNMIMTTVIGGSSAKRIIDRYPLEYGYSSYDLKDTIVASDNEEIAIWGLMAIDYKNGNTYYPRETIEDTVKTADWGLVLKVYFRD